MSLSFAFGGNTGLSYEELQRRRAFAEAMQQQGAGGAPRTAIEGLNGAAKSILGALLAKKFGAQEDKQKQDYSSTFGNIISGATQPGYGGGTAAVPPYVAPDPNNPAAIGHDTMRALGKASSAPTPDEIAAYIADAATTRGIDPSVAVAVARSEGLNANPDEAWQSNFVKNGQREPSYGPFQLYMGGGLGNSFLKQTGMDPRDGSTWKKQVDFSLDHAKSNGWGSWYGAKRSGIGDFQGISGAPQPQNPGVDPSILAAMSDPRATPEQRSALGMLLQQRMQQADPAYQLNLQKSQLEVDAMRNPTADPVKLQTFTGADGATYSFNPVTGETKPVTGGKAPDPGYRLLTADEVKAMGLPPGSYQVGADNKISKVGDGGTSVTINNGENSTKFSQESDKAAAGRFDGYIQGGTSATQMMGDLRTLADLAPQIGTGKGAEVMTALGPYAQALGVDVANLDESQAFKSIVDRLAPQMRPTGSGSSSDTDVRMFLSSLPKLGNTPEGNQIILQTLEAVQKQKMAAAEIAQLAYLPPEQGGITWQEAEKRIRALGDPYTAFNDYSKRKGAPAATATPPQPAAPAATPQPQNNDDDYLKALGLQ